VKKLRSEDAVRKAVEQKTGRLPQQQWDYFVSHDHVREILEEGFLSEEEEETPDEQERRLREFVKVVRELKRVFGGPAGRAGTGVARSQPHGWNPMDYRPEPNLYERAVAAVIGGRARKEELVKVFRKRLPNGSLMAPAAADVWMSDRLMNVGRKRTRSPVETGRTLGQMLAGLLTSFQGAEGRSVSLPGACRAG